jgi:hypothetical protein
MCVTCGNKIDINGYAMDAGCNAHHVPDYLEQHVGEVYLFCDVICLHDYHEKLKQLQLKNIFRYRRKIEENGN